MPGCSGTRPSHPKPFLPSPKRSSGERPIPVIRPTPNEPPLPTPFECYEIWEPTDTDSVDEEEYWEMTEREARDSLRLAKAAEEWLAEYGSEDGDDPAAGEDSLIERRHRPHPD